MGKKGKKRRDSDASFSSYSEQNSGDSLFNVSSFNVSNASINEESNVSITIPRKFLVVSAESAQYVNLKSDWEDVVFLHPLIMKSFNIEDLVVIRGEERTILCTAYAVASLRKDFIVFPKSNSSFRYLELVSLCNYEGTVKNAEEVFITYNEDMKEIGVLQNQYILRLLYNKYIYAGLVIKWKLIDREYNCTIQDISSSVDISNLSLKSNSNPDVPAFYKATYKTSVINAPYRTSTKTKIESSSKSSAFNEIGGMEKQIELICRFMEMFLKADSFTGSVYCGTLLLTGPPGCGKSLLLHSIADNFNIYTEEITWPQLHDVKEAFQRAKDRSPSLILIDNLNHWKSFPKIIETLDDAKVFVVATTNDSDFDASTLQTSKRIVEVVKIKIPSSNERIQILNKLLEFRDHSLSAEKIQKCANSAHGFTGRDLLEAIKDAQMLACKREFSDRLGSDNFISLARQKEYRKGQINYYDLECSLKLKKPSIVTNELKIKKVHWSDVGGMTEVKEKLKQLVEWPLKFPEAFKHFNITPSRGVLMYGPPGCSKTMIAKALATECDLNFISKNASDLYDKYVGESEKAVRYLFAMAKAKSPCIIFLDEIDALVSERGSSSGSSGVGDRIVTTLLTEMDGVEELQGVIIIAATNRPDMLDDALVRNGRINHFIYVPLPDAKTREEILKINMRKRLLAKDFDFNILVEKTEGYSGAEIVNLCNEAALQLFSEDPQAQSPIFRFSHFENALKYIRPRTNKDMIKFYENFNKKHCTKDFK